MKIVRVKVDPAHAAALQAGRMDAARVDGTSEAQIAAQQAADEALAAQDAGAFARGVRERLGLSQSEFAARIHVPLETIHNWEQGKRSPPGAAKALLKVLDKSPAAALAALEI